MPIRPERITYDRSDAAYTREHCSLNTPIRGRNQLALSATLNCLFRTFVTAARRRYRLGVVPTKRLNWRDMDGRSEKPWLDEMAASCAPEFTISRATLSILTR